MRRPHGVIYTFFRKHAMDLHALHFACISTVFRMRYKASRFFRTVGNAERHCVLMDSSLFTRIRSFPTIPCGIAASFALCVAVAFAGNGLSPLLRFVRFHVLHPVLSFLSDYFDNALFAPIYKCDCPSHRKARLFHRASLIFLHTTVIAHFFKRHVAIL